MKSIVISNKNIAPTVDNCQLSVSFSVPQKCTTTTWYDSDGAQHNDTRCDRPGAAQYRMNIANTSAVDLSSLDGAFNSADGCGHATSPFIHTLSKNCTVPPNFAAFGIAQPGSNAGSQGGNCLRQDAVSCNLKISLFGNDSLSAPGDVSTGRSSEIWSRFVDGLKCEPQPTPTSSASSTSPQAGTPSSTAIHNAAFGVKPNRKVAVALLAIVAGYIFA